MSSFAEYYKQNIGKKIKKYRLLNNLTQEQLSEMLDRNLKYIGHIERGEREISTKSIIKLLQILKIQPSEFYNFEVNYKF